MKINLKYIIIFLSLIIVSLVVYNIINSGDTKISLSFEDNGDCDEKLFEMVQSGSYSVEDCECNKVSSNQVILYCGW